MSEGREDADRGKEPGPESAGRLLRSAGRKRESSIAADNLKHPIVDMRGIWKAFGNLLALQDVSFELRPGEVHALLGENGAGKTTLMNILAGLYRRDRGEIYIDGNKIDIQSPRDALRQGIGMVHQHFELVDAFTALDNIILAAEKSGLRINRINREVHQGRVQNLMHEYGFDIELQERVRDLAVGEQQKVEILRSLYVGVGVLILDEPTTHLTPMEVDALFGVLRQLSKSGLSVVLVNHKLKEVLAVSDRITVLHNGRNAGTVTASDATEHELVEMVMGKMTPVSHLAEEAQMVMGKTTPVSHLEERDEKPLASRKPDTESVLSVSGLSTRSAPRIDVSLEIGRGEIVGIAGIAGNGQMALMETLMGIRSAKNGTIRLGNLDITNLKPRERIRLGIAVLPDDRLREGILPGAPVYESYALGLHHLHSERIWRRSTLRQSARKMIADYNVTTPNEKTFTGALSGGNIQKLLVARALEIASRSATGVLLAMNPTRGLDVGATKFVHQQLKELASKGQGVLTISEDLDELFLISDRIYVMHSGRIVDAYRRIEFDRYTIGLAMVGGGR